MHHQAPPEDGKSKRAKEQKRKRAKEQKSKQQDFLPCNFIFLSMDALSRRQGGVGVFSVDKSFGKDAKTAIKYVAWYCNGIVWYCKQQLSQTNHKSASKDFSNIQGNSLHS